MELAVFIQKHSDRVVSELFDVPLRTVAAWRRLERAPKTLQAQQIIERSNGQLTWQGIYQPYARHRSRLARRNTQADIPGHLTEHCNIRNRNTDTTIHHN